MGYLLAGEDGTAARLNQLLGSMLTDQADSGTVAALGSTASTSYVTTLTTSGATPTATVVSVGGFALVIFAAVMASSDATTRGMYTSVSVSGDTTIAASDEWAARVTASNVVVGIRCASFAFLPINPGTNTYTINHRMSASPGGTGLFGSADLFVLAP